MFKIDKRERGNKNREEEKVRPMNVERLVKERKRRFLCWSKQGLSANITLIKECLMFILILFHCYFFRYCFNNFIVTLFYAILFYTLIEVVNMLRIISTDRSEQSKHTRNVYVNNVTQFRSIKFVSPRH